MMGVITMTRRMKAKRVASIVSVFITIPLMAQSATVPGQHILFLMTFIAFTLSVLLAMTLVLLWRNRRASQLFEIETSSELSALNENLAIAEALGHRERTVVAVWEVAGGPPKQLNGLAENDIGIPKSPRAFMDFDAWLAPESAGLLHDKLQELWKRGQVFSLGLTTNQRQRLEVRGLRTSNNTILELQLPDRHESQPSTETDKSLRDLLAEWPHPAWLQDRSGALFWRNNAFGTNPKLEFGQTSAPYLLDQADREKAEMALKSGQSWRQRLPLAQFGQKRLFDISLLSIGDAVAGLAFDVTDFEMARRDQDAIIAAQQRNFDHLPTGIAVFGPDQRLHYANPAWRGLWGIDSAFLADRPEEEVVLDHLSALKLLPIEMDYSKWKTEFLRRSRAGRVNEKWYLPQGRVLRVITLLAPDGGHTVINENLTEIEDLRRIQVSHQRMLRETFEALTDAVAVFGADGRLQFSNPAFASIWRLSDAGLDLSSAPRIDELVAWFATLHDDQAVWGKLKACIFALGEDRRLFNTTLKRSDGIVVEVSSRPLPGGTTLMTCVDQTAAAQVENALKATNAALKEADLLKNDFIQHVSYELRSPLTNIIGFTEMLAHSGQAVPEDESQVSRQMEYIGYIRAQSQTLLAIIDDILDLATIDAGVMTLDITRVEPIEISTSAASALRQRCQETGITLSIETRGDVGAFNADAQRIRQVLYNLLSNAVGFSKTGQTVTLAVSRNPAREIVFEVIDEGCGISESDRSQIFARFATKSQGTPHRGVGLGLSLVRSFVELHGGRVSLTSNPGRGTHVTCIFPENARQPDWLDEKRA